MGPVPADVGFKQAMALKLVRLEKDGAVTTVFPTVRQDTQALRARVADLAQG